MKLRNFILGAAYTILFLTSLVLIPCWAETDDPNQIVVTDQATSSTSSQDDTFTIPEDDDQPDTLQSPPNCNQDPNAPGCSSPQPVAGIDPNAAAAYEANNFLNEFGGPFSLGVKYDNDLSWMANLGYNKVFDDVFGFSAKLAGGENELRGNLTAGFAIYSNQDFKITYEYLNQNLPFDFQSGEVDERVSQNAVGGAYQYVLSHCVLHAIELTANWAGANNKSLDPVVFYQNNDPNDPAYDLRNIAGGEENTEVAKVKFLPTPRTLLTVGGGYSHVDYDTQYDSSDSDRTTVAYNAELSVLPTDTTKLSADIINTASSQEVDARVSQLVPHNLELNVWGQTSHGYNGLSDSSSVMLGFSYPAPKVYVFEGVDKLAQLADYIDKPVVYYQRVLAIKDEAVTPITLTANQLTNQTVPVGGIITPISTQNVFNFDPQNFTSVTYTLTVSKLNGSSTKNYAQALNLQIVPDSNIQATVSSEETIPAGTNGQYKVTIAAYGNNPGLTQSLVAKSSFTLKVVQSQTQSAPVWKKSRLPAATMGKPYPCVDLTAGGYVITPGIADDTFKFQLLSNQSWLQITTKCTQAGFVPPNDNKVHYYLTAGGANQNVLVPTTAVSQVQINATSKTTQLSSVQNFTLAINQVAPVWNGTPTLGTVQALALNQPLPVGAPIALEGYVQSSTSQGLTLSIDPNPGNGVNFVPTNWKIIQSGTHFYLTRVNNTGELGQVTLSIIAKNRSSTASVKNPAIITVVAQ